MSNEFLNDPRFNIEGINDIKGAVDNFFANHKEAVVKKPAKTKPEGTTKGKTRLKLPDPPKQTEEEVTTAIEFAKDEVDLIREEFYEFQAAISHLAIYPYIYKDIENFVSSCQELLDMIEDNIDTDKLSAAGRKDYEELQKMRARLLSSIHNYYKKEE